MKDAVDQTRQMWREGERRKQRRQEILEEHRVLTLANALSLVRLLFLPPVLFCLLMNRPLYDGLAVGFLFLGALTDFLDGIVARHRDEVSQLGKIIDPVADKLFVGALGVVLVLLRGMPAWFVALFLARDVVILSISYLLFLNRDIVMSSNLLGKTTTAVLMLTLLLYVVRLQDIGIWFVYFGSALVAASGLVYARSFIRLVRHLLSRSTGGGETDPYPAR
ncbi:MAG: CDP-alcohol phosphatidyltransferase family protein [bacterium]